jgi:hypothetical protein
MEPYRWFGFHGVSLEPGNLAQVEVVHTKNE